MVQLRPSRPGGDDAEPVECLDIAFLIGSDQPLKLVTCQIAVLPTAPDNVPAPYVAGLHALDQRLPPRQVVGTQARRHEHAAPLVKEHVESCFPERRDLPIAKPFGRCGREDSQPAFLGETTPLAVSGDTRTHLAAEKGGGRGAAAGVRDVAHVVHRHAARLGDQADQHVVDAACRAAAPRDPARILSEGVEELVDRREGRRRRRGDDQAIEHQPRDGLGVCQAQRRVLGHRRADHARPTGHDDVRVAEVPGH